MRQVVGFGDQSMGRGTFGGEFVACHCPQGPTGRTCATAPRRGPFAKLLWADLLHISSCNMDRLNTIFNFVSLSYASAGPGRDRELKLRDRDGSEINHSGTGTGTGTTYQSRAKLYTLYIDLYNKLIVYRVRCMSVCNVM